MLFILLMLLFIKIPSKRKSGHSAAGKAGNRKLAASQGGDAAADGIVFVSEDMQVAIQPLHVAVAAAEPIDAGAGAHTTRGAAGVRCDPKPTLPRALLCDRGDGPAKVCSKPSNSVS